MVSGPIGGGKTTLCRALAAQARAEGWDVAGLLSPALFEGERKSGIAVENLRTGETRLLARSVPHPSFDLQFGNWCFDRLSLVWGNRVLEASLPCDLLIVDELGPLELLRGEGWSAALAALRQGGYRLGLVVIRPALQATARGLFPVRGVIIPDLSRPADETAALWWEKMKREGAF
jgi:nucleoside-triphosphatase THEP1